MKRTLAALSILAILIIFSNCNSAKKAQAAVPVKTNYESGVQTLVVANCSPCHIPSKGGNKLPLDTYAKVSSNIDEIIRRIELQPGDRGFMPFKHARLSDSTIAVFKQWRTDGLLEK